MQPVDFTTLSAVCWELRQNWLPARLEQVYQTDRHTLAFALRTLQGRTWLIISWHPQAARFHLGDPPPREPDTFTFSKQLQSLLKGLALSTIDPITPWERAFDLQFAPRPGEPAQWHLYVEVMGKHSNVLLVNQANQIVTAAHQVSDAQSRVRPIQTGQPFVPPPGLQERVPSLQESFDRWHEQVSLIPGPIAKTLSKTYRGLGSALATSLVQAAGLNPQTPSDRLSTPEWHRVFDRWHHWLKTLENGNFCPHWSDTGYGVIAWQGAERSTHLSPQSSPKQGIIAVSPPVQYKDVPPPKAGEHPAVLDCRENGYKQDVKDVQSLLNEYYRDRLNEQHFKQLNHQLTQKLTTCLGKLNQKAAGFRQRLHQSDRAEDFRSHADLLMAHLQAWQPGLTQIELADFETGEPIKISLNPEKNAVQNAQVLYKQHQKLKRARSAVEPLLTQVEREIHYLEQVETSLRELAVYQTSADLLTLQEIREELIQQAYLPTPDWHNPDKRKRKDAKYSTTDFYRYRSPGGFEILAGRNNHQNDRIVSHITQQYDLWFHSQEIPGSHVLLRLDPGAAVEDADLQYTADVAAYHSRARQSEQVPIVYTEPRNVYKPKGAAPGMVIYKHERIIWGKPGRIEELRIGPMPRSP